MLVASSLSPSPSCSQSLTNPRSSTEQLLSPGSFGKEMDASRWKRLGVMQDLEQLES